MFRVKAEPSNEFKTHLTQYGFNGITKIYICREPIEKGVELFLDVVTLGKYSNSKNQLHYDQIFHLYLMILLSNGMWLLLEKNETVVLKPSDKTKVDDFEHMGVFIEPNRITLNEFINNAIQIMGNNEFFIYDGLTSNCQKFVSDVLMSNGLWNIKYDLFVNQSINESLKEVKGLKYAMRKITDVANIASRLVGGSDDVFLIDSNRKRALEDSLKELSKIDVHNLYNKDETIKAYNAFRKAKNRLEGAYHANSNPWNWETQFPDLHMINNNNNGFSYLPSFEEDIDKENKDNLKESIKIIRKIITRILDHNHRLTASGPIVSKPKEPNRSNESTKFRKKRESYEEDQGIALGIRPDVAHKLKERKIENDEFLKRNNYEKADEKRRNEEQTLQSMMNAKKEMDEFNEVKLIKRMLCELNKRNE